MEVLGDLRRNGQAVSSNSNRHAAHPHFASRPLGVGGIGLITTMFSIVNAVLLRDTKVTDPSSLVEVYSSAT